MTQANENPEPKPPKVPKPPKGKGLKIKPWSGLKTWAQAHDGIEENPLELLYRKLVIGIGDVFESLYGEDEDDVRRDYRADITKEASRRLNQKRGGHDA